jgi:hypothetical protein
MPGVTASFGIGISLEASSRVRATPDTAPFIIYVIRERNRGLRDLLSKMNRI